MPIPQQNSGMPLDKETRLRLAIIKAKLIGTNTALDEAIAAYELHTGEIANELMCQFCQEQIGTHSNPDFDFAWLCDMCEEGLQDDLKKAKEANSE